MDIEEIRSICCSYSHTTEDIKWENDLCFLIAKKMFCVCGLGNHPPSICIKVTDKEFNDLIQHPAIRPAPYLSRYKWILVEDPDTFSRKEWEFYLSQSYELIKSKLPKKTLLSLEKNGTHRSPST